MSNKKVIKKLVEENSEDEKPKKKKEKVPKVVNLCKCCNGELSKTSTCGVCSNCKFNDSVTLSATNAKKQYALTDDDLLNGNFFSFDVFIRGSRGTKYLVSELETYSKKLLNSGNDSYKKKLEKKNILKNTKLLKEKRTIEINKFLSENIKNTDDEIIVEIVAKFVDSKITKIEDISQQLLDRDKIVTQLNNSKEEFKNNFTQIIEEKLSDFNYLCKILNVDIATPFMPKYSDDCKYFKIYIDGEIDSYISEVIINNFDPLVCTKADILKTNHLENFESKLSVQLIVDDVKHFIRENEVTQKLKQKKLERRNDSALCQLYIDGGIKYVKDNTNINIETLDDIIDIMEEMNFYFTKTNYGELMNNQRNNERNRRDFNYGRLSTSEMSANAKNSIVDNMKKELLKIAPKRVVDLYNKVKKEKLF